VQPVLRSGAIIQRPIGRHASWPSSNRPPIAWHGPHVWSGGTGGGVIAAPGGAAGGRAAASESPARPGSDSSGTARCRRRTFDGTGPKDPRSKFCFLYQSRVRGQLPARRHIASPSQRPGLPSTAGHWRRVVELSKATGLDCLAWCRMWWLAPIGMAVSARSLSTDLARGRKRRPKWSRLQSLDPPWIFSPHSGVLAHDADLLAADASHLNHLNYPVFANQVNSAVARSTAGTWSAYPAPGHH